MSIYSESFVDQVSSQAELLYLTQIQEKKKENVKLHTYYVYLYNYDYILGICITLSIFQTLLDMNNCSPDAIMKGAYEN